jgi:thiol-disulfide isomerase/thioredoxin
LRDYAGRPLLVNVWATWCVPCKVEMPTLDALAALEEGRLTVIAVSQDLGGRAKVRRFFETAQIANLEPLTDPDNGLLGAIGGKPALPVTILYDSDGREVWRVMGGVEWDDAEMAKLLAEAS